MRRKKNEDLDPLSEIGVAPTPSTASSMITPLDIQQKEFQVSRLGGYRMRDVDEFLDQLTDAMTAVLAENERLRSGASASPIVGSPDLDEVSRQADEIIQRARDEASRIVAEGSSRASVGAGLAVGNLSEADRKAVDAFLARERTFLQSLAGLVQEHADGVKGMVREVRRRSSEAAAASAPKPAAPEPRAETPPQPTPDPEATRPIAPIVAAEEPVVVSEPEPARARRDDNGDEGLRELFWGEES